MGKTDFSVAERRGIGLKGLICAVDNDTIEKGKNICNTAGPWAPVICTPPPRVVAG